MVKKAKQGTKVPVKRVREVADSLMDSSIRKKRFAAEQKSIGDGTVRNKVADKQVMIPGSYSGNGVRTLSGNDRLKIADKARKQASTDSSNSVRYKALADKAMAESAMEAKSVPKKKMGGTVKKAQNGIMDTKLKDVPKKVKGAATNAYNKISDKVKNATVGDAVGGIGYLIKRDKSMPKKKMGGMIKRADGSMSKRGLWDNIRANKGSGKKPTSAMLKQEKKIKAQTKKK